jgi:hypothetical protein
LFKKITFTDTTKTVPKEYYPLPAQQILPEWYKKAPPYQGEERGRSASYRRLLSPTIKKCIPMFDAISAGYIIRTHCDINLEEKSGAPFFSWPVGEGLIEFHPEEQVCGLPSAESLVDVPKFVSPWVISTSKGYSSIFLNPMHRDYSPISILPGIVDTDSYGAIINFPLLVDRSFSGGIIPAGTPLVQVIPFKRDSFRMNFGSQKEIDESFEVDLRLRSVFLNGYRKKFWSKKSYL